MRDLLDFLFRITGNYGFGILLMTLLLRLIVFPLTMAGTRSSVKMQALQAEQKELQKKYKKDPEQLNRATMELWKKHKVNPFMGCLPLLVQLPLLFGFISMLQKYQFIGNAAFLWIPHLGRPDPYFILPVLAAVLTYFQSKMTSPPGDRSMQMMTYLLPVLILIWGLRYQAGFTLYWAAISGIGVLERYLIVRSTPQPAGLPAPKK
jgi:YidC/Oxa1 family membrane protein insertase